MFDTLITSIPLLKAGRLRALGVTLPRRSQSLPDVPTIAEAGVAGYEFTAWQSIVVPAGTDSKRDRNSARGRCKGSSLA